MSFNRTIGLPALALALALVLAGNAQAQAPVGLGTADSFAVLGGQSVTNTGPTVVNGNLGVWPGNSVVGFPPGIVNGTIHKGNAKAKQAQSDLTTAYNDAAGRACNVNLTGQNLGGLTLTSGVYCFSSSAQLTGDLTLDAQGDPNAVFIFQIGTKLTTASASSVNLINGAQACNVFWQVGSSATLGTTTDFTGNILALTSITANTGATVDGRLLARNGSVTLDDNVVTRADCAALGDTTGPVVDIDGDDDRPGGGDSYTGNPLNRDRCLVRGFRLRIKARDPSGIRSIKVFLDGQLIKQTTRRRLSVWIPARRLSSERHRIRVVAVDRVGNRTVKRRSFKRCDRPGSPNFTG